MADNKKKNSKTINFAEKKREIWEVLQLHFQVAWILHFF